MYCCIRCSAERSAELTNALLCRLSIQSDEEDADADRVQQMFEDAFKGQLWAGGRCPNAMVELQRAILDGVLDLRSIEAHRLVCLSSDSQHFKGLRRGVLRAFWDLKAENGVFFRTEVLCTHRCVLI